MADISKLNGYNIKDNYSRQKIENIDLSIENLDINVNKLKSNKNGLIGISRKGKSGNDYYIVYSLDGENFYNLNTALPSGVGGDASALLEVDGVFYLFSNNKYWFTKDFINWSAENIINNTFGNTIYATSGYYDEANNLVYLYSAYKYKDDTVASPFGGTTYYFKISYQTATVNENGSLNINSTINDLIYVDDESYIDPYVTYDVNLGYLIAYKNELTAKIIISKMTDLGTITSGTEVECPVLGLEAPQLISTSFGTLCYVDGYAINNPIKTNIPNLPAMSGYFKISEDGTYFTSNNMAITPISAPFTLRHLGLMKCSDKALYYIEQIGVSSAIPYPSNNKFVMKNGLSVISTSSISNPVLVNFPNVLYTVPVSKTIKLLPEFKSEPYKLFVRKNVVITWDINSNIQSDCKGQSYTASKDETLIIYPDGNDCISGTWTPIDR